MILQAEQNEMILTEQKHPLALGIDIGSTTAKLFLLENGRPVFSLL